MSNERKSNVSNIGNVSNAGTAAKGTGEIIRVKRLPSNFVQMHKGFLEDPHLSFKAKGILGYLLTKPDNWIVRIADLMNHAKDGRDSIYAGLKELQDHKYYHKAQARDAKGRLSHWECFVCEVPMTATGADFNSDPAYNPNPNRPTPHTENPYTVKPHTKYPYPENPLTVNPYPENPSLSNNYNTNNDCSNNYRSNNDCSNNNHTPTPAPPDKDNQGEAAGVADDKKSGSKLDAVKPVSDITMPQSDVPIHESTAAAKPPPKSTSKSTADAMPAAIPTTDAVPAPELPTSKSTATAIPAPKPTAPKIQYAEFVSMTNDEYSSLVAKIGEDGAAWCIEKLDNYKGSKGKKYDSDYRTILSWVVMRYNEHLQAQAKNGRADYPQSNSNVESVNYAHNSQSTGDAFEAYVYKKIEEANHHGEI